MRAKQGVFSFNPRWMGNIAGKHKHTKYNVDKTTNISQHISHILSFLPSGMKHSWDGLKLGCHIECCCIFKRRALFLSNYVMYWLMFECICLVRFKKKILLSTLKKTLLCSGWGNIEVCVTMTILLQLGDLGCHGYNNKQIVMVWLAK